MPRIELGTSSLPRKRSTTELHRLVIKRAGDRVRTGDIQLGRLTLYQLSYSRILLKNIGESNLFDSLFLRTCEGKNQQIYSLSDPRWPLEYLPEHKYFKELSRWRVLDSNPRPADYKSAALCISLCIFFYY